ncbi:MAG: serine/threonine-protein kinase [Thermoanaerobaculia bacterium]|jgi:tetratricopeptide (TPR) repeat protein/TolB-like protein
MEQSAPQRPGPTGPAETGSRLEPGTIVAGKWSVTRRLGATRLDEIYEALDVATGATVAIRVLRRDAGSDDSTFRRFARVARRLSAVRHPNVQHIFAFATHETRSGSHRERAALLVTEALSGETLSHRVRRAGPLRGEAADALVRDLCAGLEAIHGAHALHGDITGASVLFVTDPDGSTRAVLTDLAFLATGEGDDLALARAVGSPAYRAPEQLTGGKLHRTTDIFSLGAVIYEAVTARLPFTGGNLLALDFRQLEEEPIRPGVFAPDIEPARERAILRCLERSPANRFERARDVLRATKGENVSTPRFRQAARTLGAASLLIVVMIGGSALLSWVSVVEDRRLGVEFVRLSRPSIAVMPFRADRIDERDAWIAVAATELLRLELTRDDALRVASRETVVDASRDLGLGETETLPPFALRHVRTLIGAEQALVGSCHVQGTAPAAVTVTLDLCVQDTRTGETIGTVFESGTLAELPELAARAAARVRPIAGAALSDREARAARRETWSPTGLESWARGLASLDDRRADEAVSALTLAATTDAENPAVRVALSRALWASGDVSRAIDESKRAWDAAEGLSPERTLELELRHAELRSDPGRLIEAYRRMIRTYPDRVDDGFGLVDAFVRAGDFEDATRALRSLQSATSSALDPRLALCEARIAAQSGHFAEAIAVASDAVSIASAIGARGIEGEAEVERALACASSGDYATSKSSIAAAAEAFRSRGDLDEVARITAISGVLDQRTGRYDEALASLREAERLYERIGQRQGLAATRGSIAVLLASRGRHRDAAQSFDAALEGFVAIGDQANATRSRIGLAGSLLSLGALAAAESQLRGVVASYPPDGDPTHRAFALLGLARIETARGRITRSRELLGQAAAAFETRRVASGLQEVEILRGIDAWVAGDTALARRTLQAVRNAPASPGSGTVSCRASLALARIDIQSGDAGTAFGSAAACVDLLSAQGSPGDATTARAVAAIAAVRLGDRTGAASILDARGQSIVDEEDFAARAIVEIARETIRGGRPAPMLRLADEAESASMRLVQLDALLAAAELATRPGDRDVAADALARADALVTRGDLAGYKRLVEDARSRRAN